MTQAATVQTSPAPRECCADWGAVVECRDGVDTWECTVCGSRWAAPCDTRIEIADDAEFVQ